MIDKMTYHLIAILGTLSIKIFKVVSFCIVLLLIIINTKNQLRLNLNKSTHP